MLIRTSAGLAAAYPGAFAISWRVKTRPAADGDLPPLQVVAQSHPDAPIRAQNMTRFFRDLGASGRSPVEFQIRKALDDSLVYSQRNALVDYLLYQEVRSGLLIGLHDASHISSELCYGLAEEASAPEYEHISGKTVTLNPREPVLVDDGRIIASLRHGPDRETRITNASDDVIGVLFGSPADSSEFAAEMVDEVERDGRTRGLWT